MLDRDEFFIFIPLTLAEINKTGMWAIKVSHSEYSAWIEVHGNESPWHFIMNAVI